jgi:DNA-binding MarR family transcriptional regulator
MAAHGARKRPDDSIARLATRLHSVAIGLLRNLRREDAASGLTAPRLSALSVLVFGGPCSLGALAAAEQVRPPTMTRLVTALEADGLVTRQPDPHDGRAILIAPTAAGIQLLEAGRDRRVAALIGQLETLPGEERAVLARAVEILESLPAQQRDTPPASVRATGRGRAER